MVSIDCIAVENEYANKMYEGSELDTPRNVIRQTALASKKSENEIRKDVKIALMAGILNNTHGSNI